jgi:uncharacterized protein YcfJ
MKQSLLFAGLGLAALGVSAQEVGLVVSSTPVIQQVAVPRQVCSQTVVTTQAAPSGTGAVIGAIAGGILGSTIGHGMGRAAATGVGVVAGAAVGNSVEGSRQQQAVVPNCTTENTYENRTVAWNVEYEYAGRRYTTQMPYDPGRTIQLQVSPVSTGAAPLSSGSPVMAPPVQSQAPVIAPPVQSSAPVVVQAAPAPMVVQPQVVMPAPVIVPPYAAYPAYPAYPVGYAGYAPHWPVGVSLGFVFGGHRHHHHHHHGRNWR